MLTKILTISICLFVFATSAFAKDNMVLPKSLQNAKKANIYELYYILKLDVVNHFMLGEKYDTDLKKANFKKSKEYTEKLEELKALKNQSLKQNYFVQLNKEISPYNMSRKGFEVYLGGNWGRGTDSAKAPKSIDSFVFEELKTETNQVEDFPNGYLNETIFIPTSEEVALKIEDNLSDTRLSIVFELGEAKKIKYKYVCMTYGWYKMNDPNITTKNQKIILSNIRTGETYLVKRIN